MVALQSAHDDAALEQRFENGRAVAHFYEDEICRARNELEFHLRALRLEIGASFVGKVFRFALVLLVLQGRDGGDLREPVDVKRLSRFLQDLDQFRMSDAVADAQTGQTLDL